MRAKNNIDPERASKATGSSTVSSFEIERQAPLCDVHEETR
jgi:hypothetical protein